MRGGQTRAASSLLPWGLPPWLWQLKALGEPGGHGGCGAPCPGHYQSHVSLRAVPGPGTAALPPPRAPGGKGWFLPPPGPPAGTGIPSWLFLSMHPPPSSSLRPDLLLSRPFRKILMAFISLLLETHTENQRSRVFP